VPNGPKRFTFSVDVLCGSVSYLLSVVIIDEYFNVYTPSTTPGESFNQVVCQ